MCTHKFRRSFFFSASSLKVQLKGTRSVSQFEALSQFRLFLLDTDCKLSTTSAFVVNSVTTETKPDTSPTTRFPHLAHVGARTTSPDVPLSLITYPGPTEYASSKTDVTVLRQESFPCSVGDTISDSSMATFPTELHSDWISFVPSESVAFASDIFWENTLSISSSFGQDVPSKWSIDRALQNKDVKIVSSVPDVSDFRSVTHELKYFSPAENSIGLLSSEELEPSASLNGDWTGISSPETPAPSPEFPSQLSFDPGTMVQEAARYVVSSTRLHVPTTHESSVTETLVVIAESQHPVSHTTLSPDTSSRSAEGSRSTGSCAENYAKSLSQVLTQMSLSNCSASSVLICRLPSPPTLPPSPRAPGQRPTLQDAMLKSLYLDVERERIGLCCLRW